MGVKERFYDDLQQEFENGWKDSFLLRYLKQEREEYPREDDYAQLERCFSMLEMGRAAQKDYLIQAVQTLIKNDRLHPDEGRTLLLDYGRRLGGADFFRGRRRDREKYQALLTALEGASVLPEMEPRTIQTLHEEILNAMLRRSAQIFLYDAGRKRNRDMAVLDAYCEDRELSLIRVQDQGTASGPLTQEERRDWERLFDILRRENRRKVLIPIRIDSRTGAGLYIVGSAHYPPDLHVDKARKGACYYAYFYLDELASEGDITLVFRSFQEELEDMCALPGLEEAQRWYFHMLQEGEANRVFRDNGPVPEDCPARLKQYFQFGGTLLPNRGILEREGREAFQLEEAQNRKERRMWQKKNR